MPKLIDYPRTSYTGAWEVAEVVDDTGGKCALETCARKLNRKVSGSFKAIVGSAVKFGLLTSKRELLTTTTLFRRIKHAYDKQEELLFHREAFLTPPLFTQLCRKFRGRELPVAMLDVLLIREFDVEEINAQGVAKAFIDGARMVGLLDEHNIIVDIDQLAAKQAPRRELANPTPEPNSFRPATIPDASTERENLGSEKKPGVGNNPMTEEDQPTSPRLPAATTGGRQSAGMPLPATKAAPAGTSDAIATLFGLATSTQQAPPLSPTLSPPQNTPRLVVNKPASDTSGPDEPTATINASASVGTDKTPLFKLQLTGPGINTVLEVLDADDLFIVRALLDKIERQLKRAG